MDNITNIKKGTKAYLAAANLVFDKDDIIMELDTESAYTLLDGFKEGASVYRLKIADGKSNYNNIPYVMDDKKKKPKEFSIVRNKDGEVDPYLFKEV